MKRKFYFSIIFIVIILLFTGCNLGKSEPIEIFVDNNINYKFKIYMDKFQLYNNETWEDFTIKGVNIKLENPMEEIGEKDYYRWLEQIGEMNANTIRIETIFPPEFYYALDKYNTKSENKIYFFQGIPIEEEPLVQLLDPFKLDNIVPYKGKINKTVDKIHGNSKDYKSDVSPYLIGWILGIEWPVEMVSNVNKNRLDKDTYEGEYVYTEESRPFESWLANIMDHTLTYELEKYQWERPISFVNSTVTDLLKHSYEPIASNDMVSINPNLIKLKNNKSGQFASYNIYPFYPDFFNLDPKYTRYLDHRGRPNNFAGYLDDLISSHELPILVTEFGVPSSRAMSKIGVHGASEGGLSEDEQGEIISNMYEDIIINGGLGAIISNWNDQWDNWFNVEDSKEHYGLLGFNRSKKVFAKGSEAIYTIDKKDDHFFKDIYMDHDEAYLYIGIEYKNLENTPLDTLIFLDMIPEEGNETNPFNDNINTESLTDYLIHLPNNGVSKILKADSNEENKEEYLPIYKVINESMNIPNTSLSIPFTNYETGILKEGIIDPKDDNYDSLADFNRIKNKNKDLLEIRIPWGLIGFKDPSTKIILESSIEDVENTINISGIKVSLAAYNPEVPDNFYTLPLSEVTNIPSKDVFIYNWDNWTNPIIEERLKKSYYIIQELFSQYK